MYQKRKRRNAPFPFKKLCFRKVKGDDVESEARLSHAFSILFEATARIIAEDPSFGIKDNKKQNL